MIPVALPVFKAFLKVIFSYRVQDVLRLCLNFLRLKSSPLSFIFSFGNKKKSLGARSSE